MSRFRALVFLWICGTAAAVAADPTGEPNPPVAVAPKSANRSDGVEVILTALAQEVDLGDKNLNDIPMFELLQDLSKRYSLNFAINEEEFKASGVPNFRDEKPKLAATRLRALTVRQLLNVTLEGMQATFLIRNGGVEIVPVGHAASVTRATALDRVDCDSGRLRDPLVSAVIKEKPLNEAVAKIAETYDLTVVVSPQAGDAKTGFVTARLLNVPADKALELLAVQCDLRVVRDGGSFLLTSRDHANELFEENLERARKKLELQKLREAPARPRGPPAPDKPPEPAPAPPPKPPASR
jgi:hypothetical protein